MKAVMLGHKAKGKIVMTILICLGLGYLAAVAGFWVVIAVFWDPWAEYRELESGLKAKK